MHFSFWSIYTYYILPLTCSSILLHSLPLRWSDWDLLGEYNFLQGMDLNTGFLTKRYMNMMRVEWLLVLNCVIWVVFFLCLPHLVGVLKRLVSTQLLDCGCTNLTKSLHPNYGIHLNVFLNFTHKKINKKKPRNQNMLLTMWPTQWLHWTIWQASASPLTLHRTRKD